MPDDQTSQETEQVITETETTVQPIVEPTAEELLRKELDEAKAKFAASTTENQNLTARLAAEEAARQELTKEPTEPELRTAFPLWDSMSDTEKGLARELFTTKRLAGKAVQSAQEEQATRSWNTSIELAITSNTALQGKEQAFRAYASRPQYRNVPMDVLTNSFLQTQGSAPAPRVTPKPGLETGNGGPKDAPKPKGLSSAELGALRTSDPKAYQDYLKTHEITLED